MSQTIDEMINNLAEKVGQEANDKAKENFKATAYAKIQQILEQPTVLTTAPLTAAPPSTPNTTQPAPTQATNEAPKPTPTNEALIKLLEKKEKQPPPKTKRTFDWPKVLIVAAIIALAVAALLMGGALGQTAQPTISVLPENSHIVQVTGVGFNVSSPVSIELQLNGSYAYGYNGNVTTDENGAFSTLYIIPTGLSGAYTIAASVSNVTVLKDIAVPNLRGTDGLDGLNGADFNATGNIIINNGTQGAEGPKGDQGIMGNSTAGIVAVVLSIIALVINVIPKKRKTFD